MAVIGITGSIASGKSTFRDILAGLLPANSLDADQIARGLLEHEPGVRGRVLAEISASAYLADGRADRQELRRIIYGDPTAKRRLEDILHPRVREAWLAEAALARQEGRHLLVDIPLLFETGAEAHFDQIITVACSEQVQNARLLARGLDLAIARSIVSSQMPVPEKIARSSQVVWNDGSLGALNSQAQTFAERFRRGASAPLPPEGDQVTLRPSVAL